VVAVQWTFFWANREVPPMTDGDRFRLLYAPYRTPRFRYGSVVFCEVRGYVTICGLSNGTIPWPIAKTKHGAKSLVVYKGLAKAVRRESNQAICHWWGLTAQTISKWRRILGVDSTTEGTRRLRHDYALEPAATAARVKALSKAANPERRRKIAEAKRGKPRPPVLETTVAGGTE
jgi:hypothetical protein